jgi:xanthosine utilization system XapX-like protein
VIAQIFFWLSLGIGLLLMAWGFMQMRNGTSPRDAYVGLVKIILGLALVIVIWAAFAVGAMAATRSSFVAAMEQAFQMAPGGRRVVPQCQCSIEYLGTRPQGGDVYAVMIKKLD